ncbi:Divergent AAA domain protein [Gimesia maris]|uniref:AlbA family DNA-binding domain-containing protein n=1 Tax=Gimesia maris TaxID=122 RepID=UPI00118D1D8B|nr:ATP-binding protein [Gimesia maris]QDT79452.1 Divergent AAA domain protein [Gimesia maris]
MTNLPLVPDIQFVHECLNRGEDLHTEFKKIIPSYYNLGQLISAFANAEGGAILIGIQEPGKIAGVDWTKLSHVYERAAASLSAGPNVYLHRVSTAQGDVGVVIVQPSSRAVVSAGGAFIRESDQIRPLSVEELQEKIPDNVDNEESNIGSSIAELTQYVQELGQQLTEARSFKSQLPGYLISFLLGIFASVIASVIFASNPLFRIFN